MDAGRIIGLAVAALAGLAAGCATGPDFKVPAAPERLAPAAEDGG